jgi:hypothetical protein
MKFLTLLKKELRDSLPWIIFAVISLFVISWFMISMKTYNQRGWPYSPIKNGAIVGQDNIFRDDILLGSAGLMFYLSILLGLALGYTHFWMPGFRKTWQLLIHRSVTRSAIITSKLSASAIMMICLSLAWLLLARFVSKSERVIIPPDAGLVRLGVFYAFLGFIVYMATALCALTKARWYTTKLFGLFFAFVIYIIIISQPNIYRAFVISIIAFIILIVQLYQFFLQREF